jgi:hypothetical protein
MFANKSSPAHQGTVLRMSVGQHISDSRFAQIPIGWHPARMRMPSAAKRRAHMTDSSEPREDSLLL